MQVSDQQLVTPQATERFARFATTDTSKIERRCNRRPRVRGFAVSYRDDLNEYLLRQSDLDESSRAKYFIVRMRRDHHKATRLNRSDGCQLFMVSGDIPLRFGRTEMFLVDDQCHQPSSLTSRPSSMASDPPWCWER